MTSVEGTTEGADDFVLREGELEEYLSELGSESFDDEEEIRRGVKEALENTDADGDGRITRKELKRYWKRLSKTLSTVDEVCDYVVHALQLPQYEALFRANSITGYDFPALIEKNGELLRDPNGLHIENILHRRKIMRSIKMRLLGVARAPDTPLKPHVDDDDMECHAIRLAWTRPEDNGIPIHRYRIKRYRVIRTASSSSSSPHQVVGVGSAGTEEKEAAPPPAEGARCSDHYKLVEKTIFFANARDLDVEDDDVEQEGSSEGTSMFHFDDGDLRGDTEYAYAVQAWNQCGHGANSPLLFVRTRTEHPAAGAGAAPYISTAGEIIGPGMHCAQRSSEWITGERRLRHLPFGRESTTAAGLTMDAAKGVVGVGSLG